MCGTFVVIYEMFPPNWSKLRVVLWHVWDSTWRMKRFLVRGSFVGLGQCQGKNMSKMSNMGPSLAWSNHGTSTYLIYPPNFERISGVDLVVLAFVRELYPLHLIFKTFKNPSCSWVYSLFIDWIARYHWDVNKLQVH